MRASVLLKSDPASACGRLGDPARAAKWLESWLDAHPGPHASQARPLHILICLTEEQFAEEQRQRQQVKDAVDRAGKTCGGKVCGSSF